MSYQRDTESDDERRRRQRRSRLTLLVALAIAAAVIVPLGIDVRQAAEQSRASLPSPTPTEDAEAPLVHPEEPELSPLATEATALAESLNERPRSLTATDRPPVCPTDTGALAAALGVSLDYEGGSLGGWDDQCTWSAGPPGTMHFSVGVGFFSDWTEADVDDIGGSEGCWATPVESFGPFTVLEACLDEHGSSSWSLFVPDSGGVGVWTLDAVVGDRQPVGATAALEALVEVADSTW